MSGTNTPMQDTEDLYGTPSVSVNGTPMQNRNMSSGYMDAKPSSSGPNAQASSAGFIPGIPGLGMLSSAALAAQQSQAETDSKIQAGAHDAMNLDETNVAPADAVVSHESETLPEAPVQAQIIQSETLPEAPDQHIESETLPEAPEQHIQSDTLPEAPAPAQHAQSETLPDALEQHIKSENLPDAPEQHVNLGQPAQAVSGANIKVEEQLQPESALARPDSALPSDAAAAEPSTSNHNDATSALLNLLASDETTEGAPSDSKGKQPADPEFLEAAKAQLDNKEAEWQYNTSDDESSSDSSSDDSSDEDSDDEDYEMLDPATAARMLMDDAGEDDDTGDKPAKNHQLRTKNEKPDEIVPKPDVTVTPDMKITALGRVENVVDNMILVKANTSGEYQVLEAGSVLCLEDRVVIGAVAETLGRVQEPLYVVAFTNATHIAEAGIAAGTNIFYVDTHSTFVFTEPLKGLKGTDASNLHDEELPEEEMEFSDDEAEAAYKRAKKEAKKNKHAAKDQSRFEPATPTVQPYTGGAINYDDEPDEAYTPLARPDNLQQMLAGAPPVEERSRGQFPPRGRGGDRGGRGRGRGDRGRGDRGRGRGGGGDSARGRKGPSKSFPDGHNQHVQQQNTYQSQPLPQKPAAPQSWSPSQQSGPTAAPQFGAFPQFGQQQQFPPAQPPPAQNAYPTQAYPNQQFNNAWPQQIPNPQQYQQFQQFLSSMGGQQQGTQQPFQFPPMPPPTPGGSIPAGAFVNPNFFPGQQQQPQYPQQGAPPNQGSAQGPSPEAVQGAQELLRRLGGGQQQQ